jgi:hypothetical protein
MLDRQQLAAFSSPKDHTNYTPTSDVCASAKLKHALGIVTLIILCSDGLYNIKCFKLHSYGLQESRKNLKGRKLVFNQNRFLGFAIVAIRGSVDGRGTMRVRLPMR